MAKKEQSLILCKNLNLKIGKKHILKDIDFEIKPNQFISLIGPNGAGKSSLCRVILGLEKNIKGKIEQKKKLKISYVPQNFVVNKLLPVTAYEFMMLNKEDYSVERAQYLLKEAGLDDKKDNHLQHLSGGERQRLLIAKALLKKPELLVMDEALSNINLAGQQKLMDLIYKERELLGFSILMVSHDMFWVMAQTDEVICINQSLYCSGRPMDISQNKALADLLGHEFAQKLSYYQHHDHNHHHKKNKEEV